MAERTMDDVRALLDTIGPCPCCGSRARAWGDVSGYERWEYRAWVECTGCGLRTKPEPGALPSPASIATWNRRA